MKDDEKEFETVNDIVEENGIDVDNLNYMW